MSSADQPIKGFVAMTAGGGAVPQGRLFVVNCTVAGDVVIVMHDDTSHTITVPVGYSAFPYQVKSVTSATATATYANGL